MAGFNLEQVLQQVLFAELARPLGLTMIEQALLRRRSFDFQVVERVFVGFKTNDFEQPRPALRFFRGRQAFGFAVFPIRRERHLLQAG